jgi:diguanylate cyclase (GGDEF)-like protein/PAS domain S-box-containing protein
MESDINKFLISSAPFAYIKHKIIKNKMNIPIDFVIKDFNNKFLKLTKITKEEIINKKITELLSKFSKENFDWVDFYKYIALNNYNTNFIYKDENTNKIYNVYCNSSLNDFLSIFIWEIKEELDNNYIYKIILEKLDEGLLILKNNKINYYNDKIKKLLKYDELNNINFNSLILDEYKENTLKHISESISGRSNMPFETKLIDKGGKTLWVEAFIKPVQTKDSKIILIFIKDICQRKNLEKELFKTYSLFEKGPVLYMTRIYGHQNRISNISENINDVLGYEKKHMLENNIFNTLLHQEDYITYSNNLKNSFLKKESYIQSSYRLKLKNGQYHWFYEFSKIFFKEKNIEIKSYIFDQTDLKETEIQLKKERERLDNIIKGTNAGTWEWNIQTGEISLNNRWAEIIGYSLEELTPTSIYSWKKYSHPDDYKKSCELIKKHFSGELDYYECEIRMRHKNGHWVWVLNRGKVFSWTFDKKPLLMFGTHIDISKRKKIEKKIIEMAIRDPLTRIYNRRYIFEKLKEFKNRLEKDNINFSVTIIDIDFFKQINDKYGHSAGDSVLQSFTQFIQKRIRSFDLLGRYGGEEFIILLADCTKYEAFKRISDILKDIRKTSFYYDEYKIRFTFSAGISDSKNFDFNSVNIEKLIDIADNRLYIAKNKGRNNIVVEG